MMINRHKRPTVEFDASNAQHRDIYNQFVRTRSWSHSPYLFWVNDPGGDNNLAYAIPRVIANYLYSTAKK